MWFHIATVRQPIFEAWSEPGARRAERGHAPAFLRDKYKNAFARRSCSSQKRRSAFGEDERMRRTSFAKAKCPVARSLDAIGDWWSLLIIRDAFLGRRRFGEFQKSLGLAKNILTVRLRALTEDGILATAPASDGSAYQEYVLTPKGHGIFPILVALRQWSEEFEP